METLTVPLGERSYPIHVGDDVLSKAGSLIAPLLARPYVAVVSDETVAHHHGEALTAGLDGAGIRHDFFSMPPGEPIKSFTGLETLLNSLSDAGVERNDTIIALGGGVIGDLTGFAASVLRRGVSFIQMPTTLLAQVDSSVGGKTGINTRHGKNLVGAFHQPKAVLSDIGTLDSLPPRDMRAGYAEVVKYALIENIRIDNTGFLDWLEAHGEALLEGDKTLRQKAIITSCAAKADIVAADETEADKRMLLNLGHTFGHALEAATGYSDRLVHGEAVAVGMVMAFDFSVRLGLCPADDATRVRHHLQQSGLPVACGDIPGILPDADALMDLMQQDKKTTDGQLVFILARGTGQAFVSRDVPRETLRDFLTEIKAT
ncbi:MAG: 3-dehydroquinate synthase [Parvularculales bacterium]